MRVVNAKEITALIVCAVLVLAIAIYKYVTPESETLDKIEALDSRDSVTVELTPFDPNTVSYQHLKSFGMTRLEALSIIRYREAGKVYRFREDILSCDAVSDSLYYILEPYITIGKEFKYKPKFQTQTQTQSYKPSTTTSNRTWESEVKSSTQSPKPTEKVDINRADSSALRSVYGIGEKSVTAIMEYRERLGGFHSTEQLK